MTDSVGDVSGVNCSRNESLSDGRVSGDGLSGAVGSVLELGAMDATDEGSYPRQWQRQANDLSGVGVVDEREPARSGAQY